MDMPQMARVAPSGRQPSNYLPNTVGIGRLRLINVAMGSLHLVQGILMVLLSSSFSLPIMTNFLYFNPTAQTLVPRPEVLLNVRLGPAIAAFLFLSSIAHFVVASPWVYPWYAASAAGANPARWVEYSLSSSLMIVLIAMLVGIYDIAALDRDIRRNASMILFGWVDGALQPGPQSRVDWLAYWFGVLAGAVPWIAIGIYLFGAGAGSSSRPPTFVYFIYVSLFVFFNVFALNMVFQYRRIGRWKNVLYGERVYMVLSLVAKSALAWQVFAGTLRPK